MRGINHVFKYLSDIEKYGSDPQQFATVSNFRKN